MIALTETSDVDIISNIFYGNHERQSMDLYRIKSDKSCPLVYWFHGGSFSRGSKDNLPKANPVENILKAGISVAVPNYRLAQDALYPGAMHDGTRAIQFGRYHAKEWDLDPDKVAVAGSSAGGMIALWIAFREDQAKKDSIDPIAQTSSHCQAVAVHNTQTTLSPDELRELVGKEDPVLQAFLGLTDDEFNSARANNLYKQVSAIANVHINVPPVFMSYGSSMIPIDDAITNEERIHHPVFGKYLKDKLDSLGIENEWCYPEQDSPDFDVNEIFQRMAGFLARHLIN